jgi:predicted DNA-binding transcriptional regulator AlpA
LHHRTARGWQTEPVRAELGGISRRTCYRWREVGTGPQCLKIPNGELRAWRSEFSAWLDSLREGAA